MLQFGYKINAKLRRLKTVMGFTSEGYEIIFVSDGSMNKTRDMVKNICENDQNI